MKNVIATDLANIQRLWTAHNLLLRQSPRVSERMGVISGLPGLGKTTAVAHLVAQTSGVYCSASPNWTPVSMLSDICTGCNIAPMYRAKAMEDAIAERLSVIRKPLFIDEADFFWNGNSGARINQNSLRMIETLRILHDRAMVPVFLIGMETLEQKLAHRPLLNDRIAQRIRFVPCDLDDAESLTETCCEVELAPDLIVELHNQSMGNIRRLIVALANLENEAKAQGWKAISLTQYRQLNSKKSSK